MTEETIVQTTHHLRADDIKQLISEKYNVPIKDIACEGYYSFKFVEKKTLKGDAQHVLSDVGDENN